MWHDISGERGIHTSGRINATTSTGILNNELYIGQNVWNRLSYQKHPETGRKISKPNPPAEWVITDKPHLRIIEDDLWQRVRARQDLIDNSRTKAEAEGKRGAGAAQAARRRKYLLSGLLTCGQCGGKYDRRWQGRAAPLLLRQCQGERRIGLHGDARRQGIRSG